MLSLFHIRTGALVCAAGALAVLAACSAPDPVASTPEPSPVELRVAHLSTANYLTTLAENPEHDSAFTDANVRVAFVGPFVPADAYAAVNSGQAHATSTGTAHFITMNSQGSDFVAFAIERYSGDSQGIVAAPGTTITSLEDLYGKTVNVGGPGSTGDYLLHRAFEHAGLDISQVNKAHIGAHESAAAFRSGHVDAWATFDQFFATAQAVPGATVVVSGDEIDSLNWSIHFVNREFAHKYPQAVVAAYQALSAQADAAAVNPAIITDTYQDFGASRDQLDVIATFSVPTIEPITHEYVDYLQQLEQQLQRYGFIDSPLDLKTHVFDVIASH